jgi:hypothetical protein
MQQLQKKAKAMGIRWITVISSAKGKQGYVSAEQAKAIANDRGATPTHIVRDVEGDIGRAYGAKTTPHMYVIDDDTTLAYMGAIDNIDSARPDDVDKATNYVALAMQAVKDEEVPDKQVTRPYGCSVKY